MSRAPLATLPPNPQIRIRTVRMNDVTALHNTCLSDKELIWIEHLVTRAKRNERLNRGLAIVVLDQLDQIVAFGQMTLWTNCAEISDLNVIASRRSEGIGTAMIQFLVKHARSLSVSCVEIGAARSNHRALDLYRRLGFEKHRTFMVDLGLGPEPVELLRLAL